MTFPDAPRRVLIFSLSYYPRFVGGAEVALKEITDRLPEIEFHMITLRYDRALPKVEKMGNVLVYRIGFSRENPSVSDLRQFPLRLNKFLFQFLAVAKALSLHRKYRYSAVWGMMAHATGIPAGLFKALNPKAPYLLTLQEGDPPEDIERSMRLVHPLFVQGFKKADALQPISSFLARWGVRMGFVGTPDIIPNGVDLARFSSATGIKSTGTTLITASRLVRKNGIDTVIRALALLPDVSFIVCGIGPEEVALKKLAKELGVDQRIVWRGEVSHEELPTFLASADIFIRPSRSEGMGNSFIEAMAVGIPVIATQEGGIADFLFDAKRNPDKEPTGYAVDVESAEQIRDAVQEIVGNPAKAESITVRAKALVTTQYGWDRVAKDMGALFRRLIG